MIFMTGKYAIRNKVLLSIFYHAGFVNNVLAHDESDRGNNTCKN